MGQQTDYRQIIESAGAKLIAESNGVVMFADPQTGETLTLYTFRKPFA